MKKIKILFFIALSGMCFTSCKKYLDVNTNPNQVTTIKPDLLFNYAIVNYATNRSGGDFYLPLALAAQTQSDGGSYGWAAGDAYDVSTFSTGNMWTGVYVNAGQNLHLAYEISEASTPANNAAAAQCKILLAQTVYDGTMLFGDMPYSEAWQATLIPYPKFDAQKDVLESLLKLLDDAIAEIPSSNTGAIQAGDLFYKGDLTKWKKAANAMKLRILMAMVDKDPTKAAAIGALVQAGGMLASGADNMKFPYGTTKGNQNPKFSLLDNYSLYLADGRNSQFFAHNVILKPMVAQNDPRLPKYFDLPEGQTTYIGVDGGETANENTATISTSQEALADGVTAPIFAMNAPELVLSYQEQLFFLAEIYARGLGVTVDLAKANQYYQQALEEACVYYGIDRTAAHTWATGRSLLAVANPVNEIHLQQFIDMMDRPSDAFVNWRRSGGPDDASRIPLLSIPDGAPAGHLFHRWPYSVSSELSSNPNAPKVNPQYFEKLWFEK